MPTPTIHPIVDADEHFIIDPVSRKIENESGKITLIQYDHNSERYGFTIPRYVEGHDMSLSTSVEVHYNNVASAGGRTNHGLYEVTDMQVNPDNEQEVIFTWLVSNNATQLVGSLNFVIRFSCFADEYLVYAWHTGIYNAIVIAPGIYNSDIIVEEYPDVLRQWEIEFGKAYTDIPANADLDSYIESGWYRCTSYEIAQTLTNCPVECPFVMRIVCSTDNPIVEGAPLYTKTRILYPHDSTLDTPNEPTSMSMQQVYVVNVDASQGWFGRWYKTYEPAGLTVDENDPYKLYLTGRNITGVPKSFTDFSADISGAAKKSLNLNESTLELKRPDGTVESSVDLSSLGGGSDSSGITTYICDVTPAIKFKDTNPFSGNISCRHMVIGNLLVLSYTIQYWSATEEITTNTELSFQEEYTILNALNSLLGTGDVRFICGSLACMSAGNLVGNYPASISVAWGGPQSIEISASSDNPIPAWAQLHGNFVGVFPIAQ